ncbi:MAG: glycosyltransferase, partial [Planctomycetota bacterium]|nr:glycosyltransferase [Planctomycetota bacterium]
GLMGASTLLVAPGGESVRDSLVATRALACGLPILAARLPRYTCAVQEGHTGLLLEPGDAKSWTEGLRLAAGSPNRRESWGRNGRERAEDVFHWPHIAHRFETLLLKAIEQKESKGGTGPIPIEVGGRKEEDSTDLPSEATPATRP